MIFNNRNTFISPKAKIGQNVRIGDNSRIYDNVEIGDNSTICNDCVIGEPSGAYYSDPNYVNPPTIIGENAMIRSHAIIYSGSTFGKGLNTGHRITIREKAKVGEHCMLSTLVDIQGNCTFGNYTRIYSNVHVSELTTLGDYVFIYPFTIFTNDPLPPSDQLLGATVGDYSVIAVSCSILPGVTVGAHCLIGANSVISRDIPENSFAAGSPAKVRMPITDIPSKEKEGVMHYPWRENFKRGMPWAEEGYEAWEKSLTK